MEDEDPFDQILQLEARYQAEGRALGAADGTKAGHSEGYAFGLEQGFQKFLQMGVLQARAAVWEARIAASAQSTEASRSGDVQHDDGGTAAATATGQGARELTIRTLQPNERLLKHLATIRAQTEDATLSRENTEAAVDSFDDRLRKATAKARVLEKFLGETGFEKVLHPAEEGGEGGVSRGGLRIRPPPVERQMEDFGV